MDNLHPWDFLTVCTFEDEFVYDAIDSDCSADEFKFCVAGVAEDEVFAVKICERCSTDATSQLDERISFQISCLVKIGVVQLTVGTWFTYGS